MRRLTSVLNDLEGIEQFLIDQKLYLAAGMFRGLRQTAVERMLGILLPFRPLPQSQPTPVRSWKDFRRIIDNLPDKFRKMAFEEWEGPEEGKWNIYESLVVGLAAASYQLGLSLEGAPALKHYLEFRAQQMLGDRPTLEIDTAWRWWQELRKLVKTLLKLHEDIGEHFSAFIGGSYMDIANWALDEVVEANTPDDYRTYGVISTNAFRRLRDWVHHGDFQNMLVTRLTFEIMDKVFKEIYRIEEEALKKSFPVEGVDEATVAETLAQTPFVTSLDFVGLNVKVGRIAPKDKSEESFYFIFSVEPTNDLGQRIVSKFTSALPPTYHVGGAAVYILTNSREPWEIVRTLNYEGVSEVMREVIEQKMSSAWGALQFLKDLKRMGLLGQFDILSAAVDWVEGLKDEPETQVKAWEAINDFVRSYYERQRQEIVTGEEVASQIRSWLYEAEDMLYKYGNLTAPPQDKEEQEEFIADVQDFIVETERMLSMLHGAGGMLTKLTQSGTYSELFHLVGLREGILLPPVVRRYWRYEGDKKLLLKWLILHRVVSKREEEVLRVS
jgi:hypothetical protein